MNKPSDKYLSNLGTVSLWLGFLQKNTVMLANSDAKIGVVQRVCLPPHLPDEEPPPYMSRGPKLLQVLKVIDTRKSSRRTSKTKTRSLHR